LMVRCGILQDAKNRMCKRPKGEPLPLLTYEDMALLKYVKVHENACGAKAVASAGVDQSGLSQKMYVHGNAELFAKRNAEQHTIIPKVDTESSKPSYITAADIDEEGERPAEEDRRLRDLLESRGDSKDSIPPPAKGVVHGDLRIEVNQVNGDRQCSQTSLQLWWNRAWALLKVVGALSWVYVVLRRNALADSLR
jgi:hypothetical protein